MMTDKDRARAHAPRERGCQRCGNHRMIELVELDRRADGPTLSVPQACYLLGLSQPMVREMVNSKELHGVKVGPKQGLYKLPWRPFRHYLLKIGMLPLRAAERG